MTSLIILKSLMVANALSKSRKKKKKLLLKPKSINKKIYKTSNMMCRICDQEEGEIPIFNNIVHPNLSEEIHNFSGVKVEDSVGVQKHMCRKCLDLLNGCIRFREMCQKTNKKIIEMSIKKEINIEPNNTTDLNCTKNNDKEYQHAESDSSYNVPSPVYSEESNDIRCSLCMKDFAYVASYNAHKAQCKEEQPKQRFLCDVCGKTAKSKANLLIHKAIHENVFPFQCDKCPYKGRSVELLKTHKRSHMSESELPYRCTKCPKAATTASNLARHMRGKHRNENLARTHKCTYCDRAFSFQHDMKRHIRDIHLRQGTVECDICFKKFNTKKILRGHRYKIHKVKGERQGRLPAYLQCQIEEPSEENMNENIDNESEYIV